ncbi:DNA-binding response regulator [Clostridium sp. AF19-22AC]|jgi:DNA-binding response OmpR family regulator|uniref:response regulator transcription factor n=1 Tax=Clostridia TaxID=186801 RepID=UPI000E5428AC|nr:MULTISPECIES: response regulator transcription factor [Clostridia]RHR33163.1 DNA-binding response regulator [Clostridium sp. AF19-22AC]
MHILIIEDDKELCDALKLQLKARNHSSDCCHKGSDALYHALNGSYELILLDRMLPEIDGLSILRAIRQNHITVPVILTTALDTVNDRIDGLDCGADDYLVKPYAIEELMARIRALSRRPAILSEHQDLAFSDLSFTPDTRILKCNGLELRLSGRAALLMEYFLRNPEKTLTREQIFLRIWGADTAVEDGNLDTYIYFLRKHLKTLRSETVISTMHGLGYRLEGPHVS